jgi:hypothetical protein
MRHKIYPLHGSILRNQIHEVTEWREKWPGTFFKLITLRDNNGRTPFQLAVDLKNWLAIRTLLCFVPSVIHDDDPCCGGVIHKAITRKWPTEQIYGLFSYGANLDIIHPRWKFSPLITCLQVEQSVTYRMLVARGVKLPTLVITNNDCLNECRSAICPLLKYGTCLILTRPERCENDSCILSQHFAKVDWMYLWVHDLYTDWYETKNERLNGNLIKRCTRRATHHLVREIRSQFFDDFLSYLVLAGKVFLQDNCTHRHTKDEIESALHGTCFAASNIGFLYPNSPSKLLQLSRDVITKNTLHQFPASLMNYEIPNTLNRYLMHI